MNTSTASETDFVVVSPDFLRENPFDNGVARRVKRAYTTFDRLSCRIGATLRRYPMVRIFVLAYMVRQLYHLGRASDLEQVLVNACLVSWRQMLTGGSGHKRWWLAAIIGGRKGRKEARKEGRSYTQACAGAAHTTHTHTV